MLLDLSLNRPELPEAPFDVCIVGAGAAGIALADKLAFFGRRVILIEAGGRAPSAASQDAYDGELGELENLPLRETRLRAFGGSSNHWGGWCRPRDTDDFTRSDFQPDGTWPLGRIQLEPYFQEAAQILGVTQLSGADLELAGADGNLQTIRMHFSTPPARLGENYFERFSRSDRILALLNAPLLTAEFDEAVSEVRSVSVKDPSSSTPVMCLARHYVFAMGAVENARNLLILNRRFGNRIGNAGGLVGRYYMQHLHQELGQFVLLDAPAPNPPGQPNLFAFMSSTGKFTGRTGRGAFRLYSAELTCTGIIDQFRRVATGAACRATSGGGAIAITAEHVPNADSRIELIGDLDALGQPRVRLDWRIADTDLVTLREAGMEFGRYLIRANVGRFRLNPAILDGAAPLRGWTQLAGAPGAAGHQMGGTRMGANERDGVVDGDCRVHGIANLYVAGSSVFRTCGHATPTLTIVQLALRLATELNRRLSL